MSLRGTEGRHVGGQSAGGRC